MRASHFLANCSACALYPFVLAVIVVAGGCSGPDQGPAVSGTVTFQKQPLDEGTIMFVPDNATDVSPGVAAIQNGKYETKLKPGQYTVKISAPVGGGKQEPVPGDSGEFGFVAKERIPATWNEKSTKKIEVKASGDNTQNFDIP